MVWAELGTSVGVRSIKSSVWLSCEVSKGLCELMGEVGGCDRGVTDIDD